MIGPDAIASAIVDAVRRYTPVALVAINGLLFIGFLFALLFT